jgi:hypothetical protein
MDLTKSVGYQKLLKAREALGVAKKTVGDHWTSDVDSMTDEVLADKKVKAEVWLADKNNEHNPYFPEYTRRYERICDEIEQRLDIVNAPQLLADMKASGLLSKKHPWDVDIT